MERPNEIYPFGLHHLDLVIAQCKRAQQRAALLHRIQPGAEAGVDGQRRCTDCLEQTKRDTVRIKQCIKIWLAFLFLLGDCVYIGDGKRREERGERGKPDAATESF